MRTFLALLFAMIALVGAVHPCMAAGCTGMTMVAAPMARHGSRPADPHHAMPIADCIGCGTPLPAQPLAAPPLRAPTRAMFLAAVSVRLEGLTPGATAPPPRRFA